ncbi:hypothetical protein EJ02DRAFT_340439, partial [Clathrospora elynae]
KSRDPVCSPHVKPLTGGLVVRWVTTGESPLLYVFFWLLFSYRVPMNQACKVEALRRSKQAMLLLVVYL